MTKDSPLTYFSFKSAVLVIIAAVLLSGCSSTLRSYYNTLSFVFFPGEGVDLPLEQIQQLSQPGLYVKAGDRPRALLALLPTPDGMEKWISQEQGILEMQQGRLVRSAGFQLDLQYRKVIGKDYLADGLARIKPGMRFEVVQDFLGEGMQSVPAVYQVIGIETGTLAFWQQQIPVQILYEKVEFYDGSSFVNQYWYAENNGELLRSIQKITPLWYEFDMLYISKIAQRQGVQP